MAVDQKSLQKLQAKINEGYRAAKGLDEVKGLSSHIVQAQQAMYEALDQCQLIVNVYAENAADLSNSAGNAEDRQ